MSDEGFRALSLESESTLYACEARSAPLTPADSLEERFERLQARLAPLFGRVFPHPLAARTVVVVPSLTVDLATLRKVRGAHYYEERMLCMLMLLRLPRTRVIYLSSAPIAPSIIDYYLNLLPGIPSIHAKSRLVLLSCHDSSDGSLTEKLLQRPRLLARIRQAIADPADAHLTCFTVTDLERRLALELDIPIYGCDPKHAHLGTKSGSRKIFREAGILLPEGFEDLRDRTDVIEGLTRLKRARPELERAVVKHNDGFSGEGNAIVDLGDAPQGSGIESWLEQELAQRIRFTAAGESPDSYFQKFEEMAGIVEELVPGECKRSPSVQYRVDPLGKLEEISTHDQVLGGAGDQVFLGARFPADSAYRQDLQVAGRRAAEVLSRHSVLGRFGIDFISVRDPVSDSWRHYAIEVNLRKGGTTHPFMMLQFLTDGGYDSESGLYRTPSGEPRYYFASDNLEDPGYHGLTPRDLIDIAVLRNLHFHSASQEGVVFHLIGALSEFAKLGVVCVGKSPQKADRLRQEIVAVLSEEGCSS